MEYKSNYHRNKTSSLEDFLKEIRYYLKDITNHFKGPNITSVNKTSMWISYIYT